MKTWYTYKDFHTGKIRRTAGRFDGWTTPTGPLNAQYAIFARQVSKLFVPEYLLTTETQKAIRANLISKGVKL